MKMITQIKNTCRKLVTGPGCLLIIALMLLPLITQGRAVTQQISGTSAVTTNDIENYTIVMDGMVFGPIWEATNGTVQNASINQGAQVTYTATIKWNQSGTQTVKFKDVVGQIDDYTVTVTNPPLTTGSIGSNQSINCGATPATLTSTADATGGNGTYIYQWQWKYPLDTVWIDITNTNTNTYSPTAVSATTDYRRKVTSDGTTGYSGSVRITINENLTAGSISSSQTVCYNGTAALTNSTSPTGGGNYAYQWESRPVGGSWSEIAGATNADYTTTALTSDTHFRRKVSSCLETKTSAYVSVQVNSSLQAGSIGSAQTICYGADAAMLTNTASAVGGDGTNAYQWQSRVPSAAWTNISGATSSTYDPGVMTTTKEFKRIVNGCGQTMESSSITVTVYPALNPGTLSGNQSICYNTTPSQLSSNTNYFGANNTYSFQWQSRPLGGNWTDISGATISVYTPPSNQIASTEYRLGITSCGGTVYTALATVTVFAELNAGTISGNQTICYNNNGATLTSSTNPTGGDGSLTYQWQSSASQGSWSDIVGATNLTYTPATGLIETTMFRRQITSCANTLPSNVITVNVWDRFLPGSITGTQTICKDSAPTTLGTGGGATGGNENQPYIYQWKSSVDGGPYLDIAGATSTTYSPAVLTATTHFRRTVSNTCEAPISTGFIIVTVNLADDNLGTLAGSTVFTNTATGTLTFSNNTTATIVKWQKQNWNGAGWQDIAHTSNVYNYTGQTESYNYRVVLDDGSCSNNHSPKASVEVFTEEVPTGYIIGPSVVSNPGETITLTLHSVGTITSSTLYTSYFSTLLNGFTSDQPVNCGSCDDEYNISAIDSDRVFWARMETSQGIEVTPPFTVKFQTIDTTLPQSNFVKSQILIKDHTSEDLSGLDNSELRVSYQYSDGMGRTTQSIVKEASPSGNDMVSFAQYNHLGRVEKSYLPFTTSGANYYTDPASLQSTFYNATANIPNDTHPYAQASYEASPYGRVLEQGAPGIAWQLGSGHNPTFGYRFNTSDEVLNWKADGSCTGYYPSGTMYVNELTDENLNQVITYTDLEGKQIMKKTQADTSKWLVTQNIYDDYGKLMYVLPPKFNEEISQGTEQLDNNYTLVMGEYTVTDQNYSAGSYYYMPGAKVFIDPNFLSNDGFEVNVYPGSTIGMDFISDLVFSYLYDEDGRVIEKKVPGAAPSYYVYDMYDQVLLTQDGNTRKNNQWAFVKYDNQGRPVYSGLYANNTDTTRATMQALVDAIDYTSGDERYEAVSTDTNGYTNVVFPTQNIEVLTVNYFDDYNFDRSNDDNPDYSYSPTHLTGAATADDLEPYSRGLPTSSKTRILGTDDWLQTVIFYDDKGRALQTLSNNHMNLTLEDTTTTIYDPLGSVSRVKSTQKTGSSQNMSVLNTYHYDHGGRVLSIDQKNDNNPPVTLASYSYNELGQLIEKKLHSEDGGTTYLQSVDFAYNIRGWLKNINDPDNLAADQYWGLELSYQQDVNGQQVAFNGNITATKWGDNTSGTTKVKGYCYEYDQMDRLTKATYGEGSSLNTNTDIYTVHSIKYDANGNIENLIRNASHQTLGTARIDDLDLTYQGNQLMKTHDNKGDDGFKNGTNSGFDYSYDKMGNLLTDQNKGIDTMFYNVINKVDSIHFSDGRAIRYIYSASGQKLSMKNYLNNTLVKTTDYVGNALYEDQALKLFGTSEGRVVVDQSTGTPVNEYEYALSDHTGNTRVVFTASPETSTYKAEFEEATYTQDTTYFYNIGARYNHPDPNNTGKAIRLNNATNGNNTNSVGPGISIPVYPGDTLNMSVKAYYADGSGHGTTGLDLATMTTAVAGAFGGLNGGTEAQQLIHDIFNEGAGAGLLAGGPGNDAVPSAYLNYLIFDKEFKLINSKSGFVGIQPGEDIEQTLSASDLIIEEVGYLYLYVSNESNSTNFVYFDDLSVTHNEGRVNQYSEYYPFGLKTEQSWERVWTTPNKSQFNGGSALNEETGNYETFYRPYDPAIGRFTGIDPLASSMSSWNPYQYAFNDPISFNDPNGDTPQALAAEKDHLIGDGIGRGNFVGWGRGQNIWGHQSLTDWSGETAWGNAIYKRSLLRKRLGGIAGVNLGRSGNLTIDWSMIASGINTFAFEGGELTGFAQGIAVDFTSVSSYGDDLTQYGDGAFGGRDYIGDRNASVDRVRSSVFDDEPDSSVPLYGDAQRAAFWAGKGDISRTIVYSASAISDLTGFAAAGRSLAKVGFKFLSKRAAKRQARKQARAFGVCFVAGTQVKTSSGKENIEQIKVGNLVWSYNECSEVSELKPVEELFVTDSVKIVYELKFGNQTVITTPEHPFYIENKWVFAEDLIIGDSLTFFDEELDYVLRGKQKIDTLVTVYNFKVSDNHTYYVSNIDVLVHNNPCAQAARGSSRILNTTAKQLQKKFKHAGDFGVTGNFSKANAARFNSAVNQHINSSGVRAIQGTYRGNSVIHHLNPNTGLNVIANPNGTFLSGWKLNPAQLQNVLQHGGL